MRKPNQIEFNLGQNPKPGFGGDTRGKRKVARPLQRKRWISLTLKSNRCVSGLSILSHRVFISRLLRAKAKKFGLQIADAVCMKDHIHLKLKILGPRDNFKRFLISITTQIARKVTGARKGKAFGRFWKGLAFTRILRTSYEILWLKFYFEANRIERDHGYAARQKYLASVRNTKRAFAVQTTI